MESQFQVDRGFFPANQEGSDALSELGSRQPAQSWQFVGEFQRLLGDDSEPDPLFFVDSWTMGTGAAVDSFKRRRQAQADSERASQASREIDRLGTTALLLESDLYVDFLSSPAPAAGAGSNDAAGPRQSYEDASAWTDRQAPQDWSTSAEEFVVQQPSQPMTRERACQLLGVNLMSSDKQVKAGYHRMVSQWHPDRLVLQTADALLYATARMAAINEAYSFLRSTPVH
jgi:DnaJ-domain-containing protein 1